MQQNGQSYDIFNSVTSDIGGITAEIAEAGIDQLMKNDFIKDIPVIGIALKLFGIGKKISDYFFLKKILMFLYQLRNIPINKRKNFVTKLESEKQKKKVGEAILIYLNKFEDAEKAIILGNLYKAFMEGHFDQSVFLRLSLVVDKSFIDDLRELKKNLSPETLNKEIKENLSQIGLFSSKIYSVTTNQQYMGKLASDPKYITVTSSDYILNSYGELFLKYG